MHLKSLVVTNVPKTEACGFDPMTSIESFAQIISYPTNTPKIMFGMGNEKVKLYATKFWYITYDIAICHMAWKQINFSYYYKRYILWLLKYLYLGSTIYLLYGYLNILFGPYSIWFNIPY